MVTGVAVLFGWMGQWLSITHVIPGGPSMKPNTAASFVVFGFALWQAAGKRRNADLVLIALGLVLNALTIAEYIADVDLGVDHPFLGHVVTDAAPPGRTALTTALGFLGVGASLVASAKRRAVWADVFALAGGAAGLLGIVMHIYGDILLVASAPFTIAIHTAICLVLLAIGSLAVNSDGKALALMTSRSAGGAFARRLVPLSILMPIGLGWLRLVLVRARLLGDETSIALLAISVILTFTWIGWWSASTLDVTDTARARATAATEAARQVAEKANRAKDEFLAVLGHELRNPLAPIFTALDHMKTTAGAPFVRERKILERQATRLQRLVGDLLDVSRVMRGSLRLARKPVSANTVVQEALEAAESVFHHGGHAPSFECLDADCWVDGDIDRLVQVVINLVTNSSKHTVPGGKIAISVMREGADVVVTVSDDGDGIPAELLTRVMEPFVQELQPIERRQGGLGLGLAIVRSIVELHGGSVAIASAGKGLGTSVTVRLPAISAPAFPVSVDSEVTETSKPAVYNGRSGVRVLVVDDNADAVEMLVLMLESAGYESKGAYDGHEAILVAANFAPHVVLLDIGLPGLDGYEVARRLRVDPAREGIFLIAITGFGQAEDRRLSRAAGFDLHLVKPLQFERIERSMKSLFESTDVASQSA
jgi:signal transduction histidine kinase/ActR/RegA family two-component response regulator